MSVSNISQINSTFIEFPPVAPVIIRRESLRSLAAQGSDKSKLLYGSDSWGFPDYFAPSRFMASRIRDIIEAFLSSCVFHCRWSLDFGYFEDESEVIFR